MQSGNAAMKILVLVLWKVPSRLKKMIHIATETVTTTVPTTVTTKKTTTVTTKVMTMTTTKTTRSITEKEKDYQGKV